MRPLLLKGHSRPLTFVKYNRDGDLLFTCSKDYKTCVWYGDSGERVGTYNGQAGTVWACDVTPDSTRLVTGSADQSVRIWDTETGVETFRFSYNQPCRAVNIALGEKLMLIGVDPFMASKAEIHVVPMTEDTDKQTSKVLLKLTGFSGRVNRAIWGPLNKTILTAGEDGTLRSFDASTGEMLKCIEAHTKQVADLQLSRDGTHFITASVDKTAKLWDIDTLEHLKTYNSDRPINAAAISPVFDHVILGGGQDASQVTTTSSKSGKFETKFYHKIFEEEFGNVRGHFGPINALAFAPDGRSFTSGGEEGYVRVNHMDADYFANKYVPGIKHA